MPKYLLSLFAAAALLGAGCGSTPAAQTPPAVPPQAQTETAPIEQPPTTPTTTTNPTPAPTTPTTSAGVREIVIQSSSFKFEPNMITAKKGEKIRLVMKNTGGTHDIKIDEFNVATQKITGEGETSVEFTVDKTGSFEFYCSVGKHRAMGMKGTLTVTE